MTMVQLVGQYSANSRNTLGSNDGGDGDGLQYRRAICGKGFLKEIFLTEIGGGHFSEK